MDNSENKKIKIVPPEPPQTSIDINKSLEDAIITASLRGDLKTDIFNSFSSTAQTRENEYELIDTMAQDSTIAAAIETYAEDITQANQNGDIFWAESSDSDVASYVNYLLKKINVDKQAFPWAISLVKYGDVYVKLLRKSDFENSRLFGKKQKNEQLNEDINLNVSRKDDHYALSVEMVNNPNEMFELTKFGKSMGYIKAATNTQSNYGSNNTQYFTTYNMRDKDIDIYSPMDFVHGCLEASTCRTEEELDIFFNDDDFNNKQNAETFKVRRGAGILNDLFKVWRQLSLEENAVLLNRVTRSSVVRAIQMEVGDMPVNQVSNVTSKVKNLIENKAALDVGKNMSEFTNPGPIENTIIIPTRNGKGALTINQIGGEVDPKQLTDLEWFNNKLFGGLKIPKQYFGWTDDAGGFSAGTSLSQYSSRYGKSVKRMQQCLIEMVTDMINLIVIDAGFDRYVNKFHIKMQAPITQEEIDRKADLSNMLRNVSDVMSTLNDVQTPSAKLKVLKLLLSQTLNEQEVSNILQQEIEKLESEEVEKGTTETGGNDLEDLDNSEASSHPDEFSPFDREPAQEVNPEESLEEIPVDETEEPAPTEPTTELNSQVNDDSTSTGAEDASLPSFDDLGVDGTINL